MDTKAELAKVWEALAMAATGAVMATRPQVPIALEALSRIAARIEEMEGALKATEALDFRGDCPECEGEGEPEACSLCFDKADDARLKRRAALAQEKADG